MITYLYNLILTYTVYLTAAREMHSPKHFRGDAYKRYRVEVAPSRGIYSRANFASLRETYLARMYKLSLIWEISTASSATEG